MGIDTDYKQLADRLVSIYTEGVLANATKRKRKHKPGSRIANFVSTILNSLQKYKNPLYIEKALDTIDLPKIYEGVDAREATSEGNLAYEDHIVLETLQYFKTDFFTWANKPKCAHCGENGDNMVATGSSGPPLPNPDEIGITELYRCSTCNKNASFLRINNPATLLDTRERRCGEWVNCFVLILSAVVDCPIRYVWNHEDHVWCEYYSRHLKRWIHLDPCENVSDEPMLYCENWGKKMSWVIGIGYDYVVDLSDKYISAEKQIPKASVADEKAAAEFIDDVNKLLLQRKWAELELNGSSSEQNHLKLYEEVLLPQGRERINLALAPAPTKTLLPKGRQTGKGEWTKSRGEDGD